MQTGNTNFIYKNEFDKACFQHDMTYGKSKDLVKRTQSDKFLKDKVFKIASNPNWWLSKRISFNGYKKSALLNKSSVSGIADEINYQLAKELHKTIIRKFQKRKCYSFFRDNIWGTDLADMKSLSNYNKGIKYLLRAIDLFSKYAWVVPIKDQMYLKKY